MQQKSELFSEFSERSQALALKLGINVSDLPEKIGVSPSMFHAYRSGKYPISGKAWRKLEVVEQAVPLTGNAESSADLKQSDVGDSAHFVREDSLPYRAQVDPVAAAFAKIREGLDLLEQLMKDRLR